MARSFLEIEEADLRNAVWGFEQNVKKKAAKKNWQPPPRPPRNPSEHYRGHSEEQKAAAARLANRIQGEREED